MLNANFPSSFLQSKHFGDGTDAAQSADKKRLTGIIENLRPSMETKEVGEGGEKGER